MARVHIQLRQRRSEAGTPVHEAANSIFLGKLCTSHMWNNCWCQRSQARTQWSARSSSVFHLQGREGERLACRREADGARDGCGLGSGTLVAATD